MSNTVTLGPVRFRDFEIPERINFGGMQSLAIHRLAGGARVIDALGRDDADIFFAGIFSGPDATARARALDELRSLGAELPLGWGEFAYTVVIRFFQAEYRAANWVPFRIACAVLRDDAAAVPEAAAGLAASVRGDVSAAMGLGADLAGIAALLARPDAATRGTAGHATASAGLANACAMLAGTIAARDAALAAARPDDAAGLNAATDAMGVLAQLTAARAHAGRAAANLAAAET